MGLDFDLKSFIEDMKACKPPYRCPFEECGKVYKTFSGINLHIQSHENGGGGSGSRTPATGSGRRSPLEPHAFFRSPQKDTLTYNEAEKSMEFEADGFLFKVTVYEPLEVMCKKEWEAKIPPELLEQENKPEETRTPTLSRISSKKGKKTPKYSSKTPCTNPDNAAQRDGATMCADVSEKKLLKLPEAHFKEIDDYDVDDAPAMTSAYFRFIEKSSEEQDEEVEYDMDEEDVAWLNIINKKRSSENLQKISEEQFELLMDRLEKESYFHVQTNGKDYSAPIDDDAICCVCMDGECSNTNVILFCDLCNLAVHQECYGVPYIPEGQWLCRRCLQSPSRSVECCLCPNRGGAFKQTDDGRWAHVVCGLWIPEVRFANTVFLEPIDSIDNIPPARWKLSCRVCKQRGVGACIQCHKTNCYTAFHVTCGLLAGLHMKMDTVRESSANGLSVTVRKTAFCDVHTPPDSDCKPKLDDVAALGIATPKQKSRGSKKQESSPLPVLFRGLMNFSPQCPWDKVQEIAAMINVQRKNQFFQRLMAYWTLKRQTRNGVPLIRRLQFAKATRPNKAPETPQKNAHHSKKKNKSSESESKKAEDEFKVMLEQRKLLRRLRQDLERVRLLCELIRKREQRKRDLVVASAQFVQLNCFPLLTFLRQTMDSLREIDQQEIFAEPVSIIDVPDYLTHIKKPMDFKTMSDKLNHFQYRSIDDLEADFNLMVDNCLTYNERDTIYYRAGVKMRDVGGSIIRQARRQIELVGYDPDTGLHTTKHSASPPQELSDDKLMKEIDCYLNETAKHPEDLPLEQHLKRLLELHDKAMLLHHPVAKVKRSKILKVEITKVRRKLSMGKISTPGTKRAHESTTDEDDQNNDGDENVGESSRRVEAACHKKKPRQVSPLSGPNSAPASSGRRLRPGKEAKEAVVTEPVVTATITAASDKKTTATGKKTHKKTAAGALSDLDQAELERADSVQAQINPSPAKSPAGVNRRNAVLFTRKKQAAAHPATDTDSVKKSKSDDEEDCEAEAHSPSSHKSAVASLSQSTSSTTSQPSLVQQPPALGPASPLLPPPPPPPAPASIHSARSGGTIANASLTPSCLQPNKKRRGGSRKIGPSMVGGPDTIRASRAASGPVSASGPGSWRCGTADPASFQVYRRGGELSGGTTDDDTQSGSATDVVATTDDSNSEDEDQDQDSDSGDSDSRSTTMHRIPLEPLDLVWAKCRGYPWYPALIINPKMPRTGYLHNGVPIPVPPQEVLDMSSSHTSPHYLILFFDAKRTWQWLTRDKLEPLGVDSELDKAKLVQSKKPSEKKAVKKAYEDAILHRCRVTGENATVSEDSADYATD